MTSPLHLRLKPEELEALDKARLEIGVSRSAYVRLLLNMALHADNRVIVARLEALESKLDGFIERVDRLSSGTSSARAQTEQPKQLDEGEERLVADSIGNLIKGDW